MGKRRLGEDGIVAKRYPRKRDLAAFEPFVRQLFGWTAPADVDALTPENRLGAALTINRDAPTFVSKIPDNLHSDSSWDQKVLSAIAQDLYSHKQALACSIL